MILMSERQLQRFHLIKLVEVGKITLKEAAEKIGVCYRQAKRIRQKVREKGAKGLIHGNRGKVRSHGLAADTREKILDLSREKYANFNDTHFTEKLGENEGIQVSREKVRRLRRQAGIAPKRRRRPRKHRMRRERQAQMGLMVLWDGSPHAWLGSSSPRCCFMAALDDATGVLLAGRFFSFEGSEGYLWLLREVVRGYGIPGILYHDRHSSLVRNDDHWTLEEQLAGRQEPTQVGAALEALGIRSLPAHSPQAKGRIEKAFGTLQDRLGAELDLAGITTLEAANEFLPGYIKRHNKRFAVPPRERQSAWRQVPDTLDMDRILSFGYTATVGNDNTVRLGGVVIDIPPGPRRRSYAQAKVEVRQLLNGCWRVYHQDHLIGKHASTALREPIRARRHRRPPAKAAKEHCWVYAP